MKTTGTHPDIEILYEDNHLLAVNKPSGVLSQEDHTGQVDLLTLCKEYLKREYNKEGDAFLGLLHRLDRDVSGVMIFAKTSKAASRMSEQIRQRYLKKTYHAIVEGEAPANGMLQDYLLKDNKKNIVSVVTRKHKQAKKAELFYQKEQTQNNLSLLKITLITGRPHQIRVQLSNLGYPVFGDQKYGSKQPGMIALHASELRFEHPTEKRKVSVLSKYPEHRPWSYFKRA